MLHETITCCGGCPVLWILKESPGQLKDFEWGKKRKKCFMFYGDNSVDNVQNVLEIRRYHLGAKLQ